MRFNQVVVSGLIVLSQALSASACSCVPSKLPICVKCSGEVFLGQVMSTEPIEDAKEKLYVVDILRSFSGRARGRVLVFGGLGGGSACSFSSFEVGQKYIFDGWIQPDNPELIVRVNICSHTMNIRQPDTGLGSGRSNLRRLRWLSWWYRSRLSGRCPRD